MPTHPASKRNDKDRLEVGDEVWTVKPSMEADRYSSSDPVSEPWKVRIAENHGGDHRGAYTGYRLQDDGTVDEDTHSTVLAYRGDFYRKERKAKRRYARWLEKQMERAQERYDDYTARNAL